MSRLRLKKLIYSKYIRLLIIVCLVSVLGSTILERQYQHALLFSLGIMTVLCMSYMLTVRFAWDKTSIFYAFLIGGIPSRMAVGLCMSYFAMLLTDIHQGMFVFTMMFWWIIFTALEFGMALEYWHRVKWLPKKV